MRSKAAHEARKQGGFVALNHLDSSTWSRCWNTWLWCRCLFCSWLFMTEQLGVSSTIPILKMDVAEDCIPQSPFHPFPKTPPVWGSIWSMLVLSVLSPCFCGQFIFLFKPQRHLLIRKDFNWTQFTFNSFESTFNWFSFETSKKSIDTKGFQLNSIYFQFIWICFQLIFLFEPQRNLLIRNDFTWTTSHNRASPQTNGKILNWAGKTSHNREPGH